MDPGDGNSFPYHPGALDDMSPLGVHLPSAALPDNTDTGQPVRVWHGRMYVKGHHNDMNVAVAAEANTTAGRAPVRDVRGWPDNLHCEASLVKTCAGVFAEMDHPAAQWFVRVFAVNNVGVEIPSSQVSQLAEVMIHRQLAFEIPCAQCGTLYLWAMDMPRYGHSILGVFRAAEMQPATLPVWTAANAAAHPATPQGALENMNPLAEHLPPEGAPGGVGEMSDSRDGTGERVWQGELFVRGHQNDLRLNCIALRQSVAGRSEVLHGSGWPSVLFCDAARIRPCNSIFPYMNEAASQWYVRIVPVDSNGMETTETKLVQLVKVMSQRLLAFEIPCEETCGQRGILYLWGMEFATHGHSMLGVFRPHPA